MQRHRTALGLKMSYDELPPRGMVSVRRMDVCNFQPFQHTITAW